VENQYPRRLKIETENKKVIRQLKDAYEAAKDQYGPSMTWAKLLERMFNYAAKYEELVDSGKLIDT